MPVTRTRVDIRPTTVAELKANAGQLLAAHWDEVARHKDLMVLNPDWPRYEALEAAGLLLSLGAWDGEQLVGYSVNFVTQHLHYAALRVSQNDVLFVAPDHRSSRLGVRLIHETERHARDLGVRMVFWHAKQGTALDSLLPRLGYGVQDIVYARGI